MQGIWSRIPGFTNIAELFSAPGGKDGAPEVVKEPPKDARALRRTPERMQPEGSGHDGSKKRPIAVGSQDSQPRKRVDRRGADERRLMGDYSVPNTAMRLPRYGKLDSDDSDKPLTPRSVMHKPSAGSGHRFGNTLDRASPHVGGARKQAATSFMSNSKSLRRPHVPAQPLVLPQARIKHGDGFEGHERARDGLHGQPANKRRRLEMGSSTVDMTIDDEELTPGEVVGVNHRGLPGTMKASQTYRASNQGSQYFTTTEFELVNSMSSTQAPRTKRRSKDGRASSQASSREIPADTSNGHANKDEPVAVGAFDDVMMEDREQSKTTNLRPPINLTKGYDEHRPSSTKPSTNGKGGKLDRAQDTLAQLTPSRAGTGQLHKPSASRGQAMLRTASAVQSTRPFGSKNSKEGRSRIVSDDGSRKLRDTFKRDISPPSQQRAPQRMKASSRPAGVRVSDISNDSDDVLNGEPTVGSRASGSVSPQKNTRSHAAKSSGTTTRWKSLSPGHIEPTQFASSDRASRSGDKRAGNMADSEKTYEDTSKVRIEAFYATSFILETGDLMLQYDKRQKQFDLYCDGELQLLRGKQVAVSVGESEAHSMTYSSNSHEVYLRGPSSVERSSLSNGHICIAFLDAEAVKWFMDWLSAATEYRLNLRPVSGEHMNNIFHHQVKEIRTRNAKQEVLDTKAENTVLTHAERADCPEKESIQYEPGPVRRKSSGLFSQNPHYLKDTPESPQQRRSLRQTRQIKHLSPPPPPIPKWTQVNKPQGWSTSIVYPPEGQRRVTVDFQDLERLDEGEFLNDNIISFALRRIEENVSPEHKDDVFFFNSFFYTALTSKTSKNGHRGFNYDAVKRWTKNKDLFTLPYVVVPINIDLHWFVAIICNLPSVSHKPAGLDDENEENQARSDEARTISSSFAAVDEEPVGILAENQSATSHPERMPSSRTLEGEAGEEVRAQTTAMRHLSISQEDEETKTKPATGADDDPMAEDPEVEVISRSHGKLGGPAKSKKRAPPPPKKYNPDRPTIITLDSFGSTHATETRNLKDYLKAEAEAKRSMELDIKELQGMTAKGIPEQTNFCDCGLYLVGYVEQFASDPRQFVTKVLTRQLDREADFASFNPSDKRNEIRNELLKLYEEQEASRKARKSTKKTTTKGSAEASASSPAPAPAKSATQVIAPPTSNLSAEDTPMDVSRRQKQPTDPKPGPQQLQDAAEEDELSQEVPRALPEPAVRKIETTTPPPEYSLQSRDELGAITSNRPGVEYSSVANAEAIRRMPMDDDEEMLDSPDARAHDSVGILTNAADRGQNSDLLDSLEQVVQQSDAKMLAEAARKNAEKTSRGRVRRSRERKRAASPMVVINIDPNSQLEIPESPVEQQHAS